MAGKRYRRKYRARRRRGGRRRRSHRTPVPGRPITRVRISSNPRPAREARDCAHRRTIGLSQLVDLTGQDPGGVWNITYANICDAITISTRTSGMVLCVRWLYAWSGTPDGGQIFGYLYQNNCMQLNNSTAAAPADGTIAQTDAGYSGSMPKIGFKIPWTARKPIEMTDTNKNASVAHFTHYGPAQTGGSPPTKYYIYVRVGVTFWM